MRLDKFLKVSRLIKRRTIANATCDAGKVSVNDKIARASYDVKEGDLISIETDTYSLKVKVKSVKDVVKKDDAVLMYEVVK